MIDVDDLRTHTDSLASAERATGYEPGRDLTQVATERLEAEACSLASAVAAVTCRWLLVVGELDRREAWRSWGCRGMAHWLSWKCGTSLVTARQHLEVARRLGELPRIRERFESGTLSFSKVRALCRHATPENEDALIVVADSATAAMLEKILAAVDQVLAARDGDLCERAHRRRGVHIGRARADRTVPIRIVASAELASALRARLDAYGTEVPDDCVASADDPMAARRHDALHRLVEGPEPAALVVNLHADLADLDAVIPSPAPDDDAAASSLGEGVRAPAYWSTNRFGRHRVPPEALGGPRPISPAMAELLRRIGCDARVRGVIDERGATIDLGRTSRDPSRPLRRYVLQRDGHRCRFPGCDHRAEHVHHLRAWMAGGPTDRANLVAVCRYHHRALHHDGFWLSGNPEHPDGLVLHRRAVPLGGERPPRLPSATIDPMRFVPDPTGHGVDTRHYHGAMDLHFVVGVLVELVGGGGAQSGGEVSTGAASAGAGAHRSPRCADRAGP